MSMQTKIVAVALGLLLAGSVISHWETGREFAHTCERFMLAYQDMPRGLRHNLREVERRCAGQMDGYNATE